MPRFLLVRLEAPLMAFGDEIVDNFGKARHFPGASNLTGLLANALGWTRGMREAHQRLQDRLDFAVRLDRPGELVHDFQTAELGGNDRGWTTRGEPEGRAGGAAAYRSPHLRYRDMIADAALTVALRLVPADEPPTLDEITGALAVPARPLFLGRKPCLPSAPLATSLIEAQDALTAVADAPMTFDHPDRSPDGPQLVGAARAKLPPGFERRFIADERNWVSGVHGGGRTIAIGRVRHLAVNLE